MDGNEIMKAAIFRSHFEAAQKIPDEHERLLFLEAVIKYQLYGEMPEGLPVIADALMTGFLPVLDKELESKTGGRPECDIPAEEIQAKVDELGSKKAAADFYGISERTVYNKLQTLQKLQKPVFADSCNLQKLQKTKEERRMKNEEGVNEERENEEDIEKQEERVGQSPPVAALPPALSENSVRFPAEAVSSPPRERRQGAFKPPTVEEVAEYCKERKNGIDAESFVAFYSSKGWYVGKNKMRDWKQAVITWEKRERERAQAQARASPEYKTWVAEEQPVLSDEEKEAVASVLGGIAERFGRNIVSGG